MLGGAEIVDVGLPTEDEAVQMLLSMAGLPPETPPPPEALEVVKFCDCLPLGEFNQRSRLILSVWDVLTVVHNDCEHSYRHRRQTGARDGGDGQLGRRGRAPSRRIQR